MEYNFYLCISNDLYYYRISFSILVYEKLLKSDYKKMYEAYSFSLSFDITLILNQIGLISILTFILGIFFARYKRKNEITHFLILKM